jgi:flagellar hook-basal body complex protein FliE
MQVQSVGSVLSNALSSVGSGKSADASGSFQNILSDAMDAADQTDAANQVSTAGLLSGDTNSLSDAVIASEKADIALSLTVQIRNRVIDAYNEVMRMQV